jgi:hypothetical protein
MSIGQVGYMTDATAQPQVSRTVFLAERLRQHKEDGAEAARVLLLTGRMESGDDFFNIGWDAASKLGLVSIERNNWMRGFRDYADAAMRLLVALQG